MTQWLKRIGGIGFSVAIVAALGFGAHEVYATGDRAACSEPGWICNEAEDCRDYCFDFHSSMNYDCDTSQSCCVCS